RSDLCRALSMAAGPLIPATRLPAGRATAKESRRDRTAAASRAVAIPLRPAAAVGRPWGSRRPVPAAETPPDAADHHPAVADSQVVAHHRAKAAAVPAVAAGLLPPRAAVVD